MSKFSFLFLLFLIPISIYGVEDSILNCDQFSASWWQPFTWFNEIDQDLYNACVIIMAEDISIESKKLKILSLYNPNEHVFNYEFVNKWNDNLDIEIKPGVEGIVMNNLTYIKNGFFIFSAITPSVLLSDQKNTHVIPFNPNLKVDYGYEIKIPDDEVSNKYPNFTSNGYCKEEYNLKSESESFDLFVDKDKKVGEALGKEIQLDLKDQGEHTLDGLYNVKVEIDAKYTQWEEFCCSYDSESGACTKYCHECSAQAGTQTLSDQLILIDFKNVSIEQPNMNIAQVIIDGVNEDLTASVTIDGIDKLQRYNFNNWYVMTNYRSQLIYLYPPINYLQLKAIENTVPRYQDLFLNKTENVFTFKTSPENKAIFLDYNGFFFNNTIKMNLTYKHFTYLDVLFDKWWYEYDDEVNIAPYIFREKTRCKNCSVLIDNVKIGYGNVSKTIKSNSLSPELSVSFIYKEDVDCVSISYEGDEEHYPSNTCIKIPHEPIFIKYLWWAWSFFISVSLIVIMLRFAYKR